MIVIHHHRHIGTVVEWVTDDKHFGSINEHIHDFVTDSIICSTWFKVHGTSNPLRAWVANGITDSSHHRQNTFKIFGERECPGTCPAI